MTVNQRARGRVPLDQRSVIPSVTGVPWWGAFACAAIAIAIGYLVDAMAGTELTMFFSTMYLVGCLVAVLMVQNRSIFTAMVQPPLLMVIAVPLAYKSFVVGPTQGLKSLILDLALPLIDRFPTMMFTTLLIWIIGAFRLTLYVQEKRGKQVAGGSRRAPRKTTVPPARQSSPRETAMATAASSRIATATATATAAATPSPRRAADTRQAGQAGQAGQARRAQTGTRTQEPPTAQEPSRAPRRAAASPQGIQEPRTPERPARPPHDDAPAPRSSRGHRYADEPRRGDPAPPATPGRRARPMPEPREPAAGQRRRQPNESVREFTERKGDTPRSRADLPDQPPPRPERDHPLPNVRYRD